MSHEQNITASAHSIDVEAMRRTRQERAVDHERKVAAAAYMQDVEGIRFTDEHGRPGLSHSAADVSRAFKAAYEQAAARYMVDQHELTRHIFPAAAAAWDREVQYGLDCGKCRAGAINDAYLTVREFKPEVNLPECEKRVRDAFLALEKARG